MFALITLLLAGTAAVMGFSLSRNFVRRRLAYVEAAQSAAAPVLAGIGAAAIAAPVTWVLPLVGTGTALIFGTAVAMGVATGAKDIRRRLRPG